MPLLSPRCARRLLFKGKALRAVQPAGSHKGCGFLYVIARREQPDAAYLLFVITRSEATRQSKVRSCRRLPRPPAWPRNDIGYEIARLAAASLAITVDDVIVGRGRYPPKRQRKPSEPSGRVMRTKPSAASTVRHSPAKHSRSYIAATDRQPPGANSCAWRM